MKSKKIVLSILGILLFSIFTCATASPPDSIYFDSNRVLMFTYESDFVSVLEVSFDHRNNLVLEERTANRSDSSYMNHHLYSYGDLRLNTDCENELLGKKIPVPYKYGYHDYVFFAPGRYAIVRWEKNQYGNTDEYRTEHYTFSKAWQQESIGELNFGVMYNVYHCGHLRHTGLCPVHFRFNGSPVIDMSPYEEVNPNLKQVEVQVRLVLSSK